MGIFKNDDQKSSQFGFDEKSMAGKAVKAGWREFLWCKREGRVSAPCA